MDNETNVKPVRRRRARRLMMVAGIGLVMVGAQAITPHDAAAAYDPNSDPAVQQLQVQTYLTAVSDCENSGGTGCGTAQQSGYDFNSDPAVQQLQVETYLTAVNDMNVFNFLSSPYAHWLAAQHSPAASAGSGGGACAGTAWNPNDGTGVSCAQYLAWSKVATCEQGGWVSDSNTQGPRYYGDLGISAANMNSGYNPNGYNLATAAPDQQISVAVNINGSYVPDQNGCGNGW